MSAEAAGAILAREYEQLKPDILRTVRGKLAGQRIALDDADLDAAYNQAWHAVYSKLAAGEAIENRNGLLVSIAHRRAIDEYRSQHPDRRADEEALAARGVERDLAAGLDDQIRLRQFLEGMRERLDERERTAAALCYLHDYTRPEAAALLGIKPRRMEKIMDEVSKKVGAFVGEIQAGEWCDTRRSLVKAYALGMLDPSGERYRQAGDHLDECPACRRRVLLVRGMAAAAPPVPAIAALAGGQAGATSRPSRSTGGKTVAIAAGCACVLAAGAFAAGRLADDGASDRSAANGTAAATAAPGGGPAAPGATSAAPGATATTRAAAGATPAAPGATATASPDATATATATASPAATKTPRPRRASSPDRRTPRRERTRSRRPAPTPTAPTPAAPPPAAPTPAATAAPVRSATPAPSPAPSATPPVSYDGAEEFDLR